MIVKSNPYVMLANVASPKVRVIEELPALLQWTDERRYCIRRP
jgi:hypothetical protein